MDITLFKSLVLSSVNNNKALDDVTKNSLKQFTTYLPEMTAVFLGDNKIVDSLTTWSDQGLQVEQVDLAGELGNLVTFQPLHDGSFILVQSNKPALHYNDDLTLKGTIPFEYVSPSISSDPAYINPGSSSVITYSEVVSNVSVPCSLVLITIPSLHIVQCYKYSKGQWKHFAMIGTLNTAGNGSSPSLSTPTAISGIWENTSATSTNFRIWVSCLGSAASGATSFIKELSINLAGTAISDYREASYPGQYLTRDAGAFKNAETRSLSSFFVNPDRKLVGINDTYELGSIVLAKATSTDRNTAVFSAPVVLQNLDFNDVLKNITTVRPLSSGNLLIGDNLGHLASVSPDASEVIAVIGQAANPPVGVSPTYPELFGPIIYAEEHLGWVYFISSSNKVYKTNFLNFTNQQIVWASDPQPLSFFVEKLSDLPEGEVSISMDGGLSWRPPEFYNLRASSINTVVLVKVTRTAKQAKEASKSSSTKNEGVLIVRYI
jgi:hypothetical protein